MKSDRSLGAAVDESVGQVLDYLDERGLTQNTIVVYTSNQGFCLGDHGRFDKRFMYDLKFDPRAMRNVYADPAYADTVDKLRRELDRLRVQYRVPDDPKKN